MSGMYPSLEDMKVDQLMRAQQAYAQQAATVHQPMLAPAGAGSAYPSAPSSVSPPPAYTASTDVTVPKYNSALYPSLEDYMGLNLTDDMIQANMPNALAPIPDNQVATRGQNNQMIAPISGTSVGLRRAEVAHGIREVTVCKDAKGIVGLRVRSINKGVFVTLVHANTPAAMAGLRFGDQIIQFNGENTAGWDTDKAMKAFKQAAPERIVLAVRDRPFERTITMHKDSGATVGFQFDNGKITGIVKDSSAARNGILTEHQLLEVDGQNVIGLKDKEIAEIFEKAPRTVTITIMPSFLFDHMMKCMKASLVKKAMDHSIPDV